MLIFRRSECALLNRWLHSPPPPSVRASLSHSRASPWISLTLNHCTSHWLSIKSDISRSASTSLRNVRQEQNKYITTASSGIWSHAVTRQTMCNASIARNVVPQESVSLADRGVHFWPCLGFRLVRKPFWPHDSYMYKKVQRAHRHHCKESENITQVPFPVLRASTLPALDCIKYSVTHDIS
jgi:hypothetical protein